MFIRSIRRAFAPRNLVATSLVALSVAGVAVAAIGSADITDNSITSQDIKNHTVSSLDIKNNSVSSLDIMNNSVSSLDIMNNSVTSLDIKNASLIGADVKPNTLTGARILESSLGKVPTATLADTATVANTVAHTTWVSAKLPIGGTKLLGTKGPVSLTATCTQSGGSEIVNILASTTTDASFLSATDTLDGGPAATDFLNTTTAETDREFVRLQVATGTIQLSTDIDEGVVVGPDGSYIAMDSETLALGTNVLGSACVVAGYMSTGTIA